MTEKIIKEFSLDAARAEDLKRGIVKLPCLTTITDQQAESLVNAGFRIVGDGISETTDQQTECWTRARFLTISKSCQKQIDQYKEQ